MAFAQPTEDYRELICSYDWPCTQALAVARCESTMNPRAANGNSLGLFQIHYPSHSNLVPSAESLYDAETNIRVAYQIYQSSGGWGPWACRP